MNFKIILAALAFASSAQAATVSIQGLFGELYDSSGANVGNNTLFILVASSTGTFAGGFGTNGTLGTAGANSAFTIGQTLNLNDTLGTGGTIFAIGGTGGSTSNSTAEVTLTGITLAGNFAAGNNYAIYWFAGSTYAGGNTGTVGSQVGGFNTTTGSPTFGLGGMIVPADGGDASQGFATTSLGGTYSSTLAVNLIPEPSTLMLSSLGVFALLRRRR